MNNVLVCDRCGALYAAFVYRDKLDAVCEVQRMDRPGIDGRCGGKLGQFGHVEPWRKA